MNNHKLNILFVIRNNRTRIDGKTPLLCRLTYKKIRKPFATTVLLYNDVPMEIVSEFLGHTKLQTTQQSYGKIVKKKVSEEMKRLNKKLTP